METQSARMKCPYCSEEISTLAKKCRHCGEWLSENAKAEHFQNTMSAAEVKRGQYAGFWIRLVAHVIDGIIMGILLYLLPVVGWILYFAYFIFMTHQYQATLGKMAVGIKVVAEDFGRASTGSIVLRETLGKIVSGLILFIGYFMAGFTKKKQALHDIMASTLVVTKN